MITRIALSLLISLPPAALLAADVQVREAAGLRSAVTAAKPGTRILLAPGSYGGSFHFRNVQGEKGRPIVIAAADEKSPPVFENANVGIHFSGVAHVELHGLTFTRLAHNGLNIDDGGEAGGAKGIVLKGLRVTEIGSRGNHDGIKLSGVEEFVIEGCHVEKWGTNGGSGIDMVGCHRGVIERNVFRHEDPPGSNAVQCKGSSSEIVIRANQFDRAGGRGVNIGGSTGMKYFRPPLKPGGEHAEARGIRVEGNRFAGCMAPVAFVGVDGAVVRFNTFEKPGRWALRILQETKEPGFVPSRNGEFTDNVIIFESGRWSEGGVNVGGGTAPETFKFARNWWYCEDRPERSKPRLPVEEVDGVYGRKPEEAKGKAGFDAWRAER